MGEGAVNGLSSLSSSASCNDGKDCLPSSFPEVRRDSGGEMYPFVLMAEDDEGNGSGGGGGASNVVGLIGEAVEILARAIDGCRWWN
jgi:hypothetical protein